MDVKVHAQEVLDLVYDAAVQRGVLVDVGQEVALAPMLPPCCRLGTAALLRSERRVQSLDNPFVAAWSRTACTIVFAAVGEAVTLQGDVHLEGGLEGHKARGHFGLLGGHDRWHLRKEQLAHLRAAQDGRLNVNFLPHHVSNRESDRRLGGWRTLLPFFCVKLQHPPLYGAVLLNKNLFYGQQLILTRREVGGLHGGQQGRRQGGAGQCHLAG
mmetsp:Transcript_3778/g.9198  ORF Transcript_3778/g.9198 Transcript_3778/m.9198 type:complete len:213 (+) Transcript_3778:937-1575(+)